MKPVIWFLCLWLPGLLLASETVSEPEVVALLQKACDQGEADNCTNLAAMYYSGDGVAQNRQKAFQLFDQACKGGDMTGCANLARMYELGEAVGTDKARARQLYARACEEGVSMGCQAAKRLQHDGR